MHIPKKPKSKSKHRKVKIWEKYEIKDGKVIRKNRFCPKCKSFLANMKDRFYCGKCGYVEIKKIEQKGEAVAQKA